MSTLIWKFNRLRMMGFSEILWRTKKNLKSRFSQYFRTDSISPPPCNDILGRRWTNSLPVEFDINLYVSAADEILAGRYDVFALRTIALGFPPNWRVDPKTGTEAPQKFGREIDYRDERIVGDIKYLWEINRHHELVTLAQAWHLSGEKKYAIGCREYVLSWLETSPYLIGLGWSSSLENSIRLVNWAISWQLLTSRSAWIFDGVEGELFKQRWKASIFQHSQFIAGNFSLYSSANNHLLGEFMGLFIGSVTWPCWEESTEWLTLGKNGLEKEALKQISADGVNREQAIWYQHEVADMMLLSGLLGRANNVQFSKEYWRRLEVMLEFIYSMMDVAGNVPMIGDSDDALIVRFSKNPNLNVYRELLTTGAVLFDRGDFRSKTADFEDKSRWLLGDNAEEIYLSLNEKKFRQSAINAFPDGGYYVLGGNFGTLSEIKIIVDAGPIGYLAIAAHGHADALAFTLSIRGVPFLIDPGTYAYHTNKIWRDYFRGTSAHNTIRVDGRDQSEAGGNFMWVHKANALCEFFEIGENADYFTGSHDGYLRLRDPVEHIRKISFLKNERRIIVEDILECREMHDIEYHWHFFNTCVLKVDGSKVRVINDGVSLEMSMDGCNLQPKIIAGREQPPLGWLSNRLDEKTVTPTVVWKERIIGRSSRVTIFQIHI